MKTLLQLIDLRFIVRLITIALLGMQIALIIIFLEANQMKEASSAFALAAWMILALMFETKAHNLQEEKENLVKFLNTPSVESEGGEA
jgi:uncharacterized membrane protein